MPKAWLFFFFPTMAQKSQTFIKKLQRNYEPRGRYDRCAQHSRISRRPWKHPTAHWYFRTMDSSSHGCLWIRAECGVVTWRDCALKSFHICVKTLQSISPSLVSSSPCWPFFLPWFLLLFHSLHSVFAFPWPLWVFISALSWWASPAELRRKVS